MKQGDQLISISNYVAKKNSPLGVELDLKKNEQNMKLIDIHKDNQDWAYVVKSSGLIGYVPTMCIKKLNEQFSQDPKTNTKSDLKYGESVISTSNYVANYNSPMQEISMFKYESNIKFIEYNKYNNKWSLIMKHDGNTGHVPTTHIKSLNEHSSEIGISTSPAQPFIEFTKGCQVISTRDFIENPNSNILELSIAKNENNLTFLEFHKQNNNWALIIKADGKCGHVPATCIKVVTNTQPSDYNLNKIEPELKMGDPITALGNYVANDTTELNLQKFEVNMKFVEFPAARRGWAFIMKSDGSSGNVPINFIKKIYPSDTLSTVVDPNDRQFKIGQKLKALYSYDRNETSLLGNELSIFKDEHTFKFVEYHSDERWSKIIKSDNSQGYVPTSYIARDTPNVIPPPVPQMLMPRQGSIATVPNNFIQPTPQPVDQPQVQIPMNNTPIEPIEEPKPVFDGKFVPGLPLISKKAYKANPNGITGVEINLFPREEDFTFVKFYKDVNWAFIKKGHGITGTVPISVIEYNKFPTAPDAYAKIVEKMKNYKYEEDYIVDEYTDKFVDGEKLKATYSYTAIADSPLGKETSLEANEVNITFKKYNETKDWVYVKRNSGEMGFVPLNYVVKDKKGHIPIVNRNLSEIKYNKASSSFTTGAELTVKFSYEANVNSPVGNELSLKKNTANPYIFESLSSKSKKWALVKDDQNNKGYVPIDYIEIKKTPREEPFKRGIRLKAAFSFQAIPQSPIGNEVDLNSFDINIKYLKCHPTLLQWILIRKENGTEGYVPTSHVTHDRRSK